MKFLVMWRIEIALMSRGVVDAVLKMADYAKPLEENHKVLSRYHIPGAHGGAWIYDVNSNEELDMLLARHLLVAQQQDAVVEKRAIDFAECLLAHVAGRVDVAHLGAEAVGLSDALSGDGVLHTGICQLSE